MSRLRYRKDREDWPDSHEIKLANGKSMKVHPCTHPNHSFYFDSPLTYKRMCEISDWIGSLTDDQRLMLQQLRQDEAFEVHFNSSEDA